ncbi:MAG: UvrB/UvrC motif-containing protein [Planctomycetota bacterium]
MKYKCDQCDRPATYHAVEIVKGKKIEKHLCDQCAAEDGLSIKSAHAPINELLTNFVKASGSSEKVTNTLDLTCPDCGLSFSEFRDKSLLGCSGCYATFEAPLTNLLERAHEGGNHHVGKVPRRGGGASEQRQLQITRIRKRLDDAVDAEDYELAAQLRDDLTELENGGSSL